MRSDTIDPILAIFAPLGPQRVWSLVISVFGDLAREQDQWIDGPLLMSLLGDMGVKPDAARVALHRLRGDGWIVSQKVGRTSRHALSDKARAESQIAAARIYASTTAPQAWHVVILPDGTTPDPVQYAPITQNAYVGGLSSNPLADALVMTPETVPGWVRGQVETDGLLADYATLEGVLTDLDATIPSSQHLSARQIAVLRCLIVHNWRRLVLKHPDLPAQLYSDRWRGHACRTHVGRLLSRLPRPELAEMTR